MYLSLSAKDNLSYLLYQLLKEVVSARPLTLLTVTIRGQHHHIPHLATLKRRCMSCCALVSRAWTVELKTWATCPVDCK